MFKGRTVEAIEIDGVSEGFLDYCAKNFPALGEGNGVAILEYDMVKTLADSPRDLVRGDIIDTCIFAKAFCDGSGNNEIIIFRKG